MLCDDHGSGLGFVNAHDEHEHTSDGLNIPPSPTINSISGRFRAALSPWLFRDAAGALEARLVCETTLTVPPEPLRQ
jgi:hypothetical protein